MFLYEVDRRRKTLPDDIKLAMMLAKISTADVYESDPEEVVRTSWREDGLWSSYWSVLPPHQASWPHKNRDEEYEALRRTTGIHRVTVIMPVGSRHCAQAPGANDID
jgi:hypothetical protein